jgi:hypothetical protein
MSEWVIVLRGRGTLRPRFSSGNLDTRSPFDLRTRDSSIDAAFSFGRYSIIYNLILSIRTISNPCESRLSCRMLLLG